MEDCKFRNVLSASCDPFTDTSVKIHLLFSKTAFLHVLYTVCTYRT